MPSTAHLAHAARPLRLDALTPNWPPSLPSPLPIWGFYFQCAVASNGLEERLASLPFALVDAVLLVCSRSWLVRLASVSAYPVQECPNYVHRRTLGVPPTLFSPFLRLGAVSYHCAQRSHHIRSSIDLSFLCAFFATFPFLDLTFSDAEMLIFIFRWRRSSPRTLSARL
jgi:hypothetical protein